MVSYEELLAALEKYRDEQFRAFNERIVNVPPGSSVGVRTPQLRAFGRQLIGGAGFDLSALLSFPNEVYEVRLLKCFAVATVKMPFSRRVAYIDRCLSVIDGWAVCDLFCSTLKEIRRHREEFFPRIEGYVAAGSEFSQRFGYVVLLGSYMEEEYLPRIFSLLRQLRPQYFYARMGAAWLLAEVLVKFFDRGVRFLEEGSLDKQTHNKGIQKARESYRLTQEQKNFLKFLKKG